MPGFWTSELLVACSLLPSCTPVGLILGKIMTYACKKFARRQREHLVEAKEVFVSWALLVCFPLKFHRVHLVPLNAKCLKSVCI